MNWLTDKKHCRESNPGRTPLEFVVVLLPAAFFAAPPNEKHVGVKT
jgi:hypothetical protein